MFAEPPKVWKETLACWGLISTVAFFRPTPAVPHAFALLWCAALFLAPGIVEAHARLIESSPSVNATIQSSPRRITITFDEPVKIESKHALVIMRTDGTPVPCAGGPQPDSDNAARVICTPASPLGRGAYNVFWLVTSKDTHVVHGSFAFGVGVTVRQVLGTTDYPYDPSGLAANVFRWIALLGAVLVVGTLAFEAFVLRAAAFPDETGPAVAALTRSCGSLRRTGICIAAFGSVLALGVQAAAATGSDPVSAVSSLPAVIVGSTWGLAWLARMCALAGIALLTWRGSASPVSLGLCALLLLSYSVSGHAVATYATLAADWIHMTCAALWFGGLAVFGVGFRRALTTIEETDRTAFTTTAISRFSAVALPAVAALIASGVYGSVAHFVTWKSLTQHPYGRIVLAKALLLMPLLMLGYKHFRSARRAPARTFPMSITFEAALVVVVLALSAVLSGLPPPLPPGSDHG